MNTASLTDLLSTAAIPDPAATGEEAAPAPTPSQTTTSAAAPPTIPAAERAASRLPQLQYLPPLKLQRPQPPPPLLSMHPTHQMKNSRSEHIPTSREVQLRIQGVPPRHHTHDLDHQRCDIYEKQDNHETQKSHRFKLVGKHQKKRRVGCSSSVHVFTGQGLMEDCRGLLG
nr:uncharacterized protein KIAA0754-like [Procambarus clarkii]